jgi:hypothetical protein
MATLLVGAALAVGACGTTPSPTDSTAAPPSTAAVASGMVTGIVSTTSCPVVRVDQPCPATPVAATVMARTADGAMAGSGATDGEGRYRLVLPSGRYTLAATAATPYPRCPEVAATVVADQTTTTDLACDSGIR